MRLVRKKSQKALDTSKRLHRNKTRSARRAGKGLDAQLHHYWEVRTRESAGASHLRHLWGGGGGIPVRWRLQPGL